MGIKTVAEVVDLVQQIEILSDRNQMIREQDKIREQQRQNGMLDDDIRFDSLLDLSVLSVRLQNVLKKAQILTVEALVEYPRDQWIHVDGIGQKTFAELMELIDHVETKLEVHDFSVPVG